MESRGYQRTPKPLPRRKGSYVYGASGRSTGRDPAAAQRIQYQPPVVAQAELVHRLGAVNLDGAWADEQPGADLGIRVALGRQMQHLPFTDGEELVGIDGGAPCPYPVGLDRPLRQRRADVPLALDRAPHRQQDFRGARALEHVCERAAAERLASVCLVG